MREIVKKHRLSVKKHKIRHNKLIEKIKSLYKKVYLESELLENGVNLPKRCKIKKKTIDNKNFIKTYGNLKFSSFQKLILLLIAYVFPFVGLTIGILYLIFSKKSIKISH